MRCEFNEEEFQTMVQAAYLKIFSELDEFDMSMPSRKTEYELGYDSHFEYGIPLYLQYKVSDYFPNDSRTPLLIQRGHLGYDDSCGCYAFNLHHDNSNRRMPRIYTQHNLLFSLGGLSFYVAPKFHKKSVLINNLKRWLNDNNSLVYSYVYYMKGFPVNYSAYPHPIPFLDDCIYIKPHLNLGHDTHEHRYAYNMINQVSFHSESTKVEDEDVQSIFSLIRKIYREKEHLCIPITNIEEKLASDLVDFYNKNEIDAPYALFESFFIDNNGGVDNLYRDFKVESIRDMFNILKEKGLLLTFCRRMLKELYNINQYIMFC